MARSILRNTITTTVGFEKLGEATDTPPKSFIRMSGPRGNPQAKNLFDALLQAAATLSSDATDTA